MICGLDNWRAAEALSRTPEYLSQDEGAGRGAKTPAVRLP